MNRMVRALALLAVVTTAVAGAQPVQQGNPIPRASDFSAREWIYFTDPGEDMVARIRPDGSGFELLTDEGGDQYGIDIDWQGGFVVWADARDNHIRRAGLQGENPVVVGQLQMGTPTGVALDPAHGRLFWTDPGVSALYVSPMDGSAQQLIIEDLDTREPRGIFLDAIGGFVYYADSGDDEIGRVPVAGGPSEILVDQLAAPTSVQVDFSACKVYWSEETAIARSDFDGSNRETLVQGLDEPREIALDLAAGHLYWTHRGAGRLERSNLDGSGRITLYTSNDAAPFGLRLGWVDPAGDSSACDGGSGGGGGGGGNPGDEDWIYFTDRSDGLVARMQPDGAGYEVLVSGLSQPMGIVVDVDAGYLYWVDPYSDELNRARLDGSQVTTLVSGNDMDHPLGVTLDPGSGLLYWTDRGRGEVRRAAVDGSGVTTVIGGLDKPEGIALDPADGWIYWSDYGSDTIERASLSGGSRETLFDNLDNPYGIALDLEEDRLYWASTEGICGADIGNPSYGLLVTDIDDPQGVQIDPDTRLLYWTDDDRDVIARASRFGSALQVLRSGMNDPYGIALGWVALGASGGGGGGGGGTSTAPIAPSAATPQQAGTEFWLEVVVGTSAFPVADLFGVSFDLLYDDAHLSAVGDEPGSFLGSDLVRVVERGTSGIVSAGLSRKAGAGGVSGSGTVLRVRFAVDANASDGRTETFRLENVTAMDASGGALTLVPSSLSITIRSGLEVWPGDTNNSGSVTAGDVLPIGFHWGQTGPIRTGATNAWTAQVAQPWSSPAVTYVDANGNGRVDAPDVFPIGLNWGRTHTVSGGSATHRVGSRAKESITGKTASTASQGLQVRLESSRVQIGEEFWLSVDVLDAADLFGLAFEMFIVPAVHATAIEVLADPWFGNDLVFLPYIDAAAGLVSVGISRKAGQPALSGSGTVLRIRLVMHAPTGQSTAFQFANVEGMDGAGAMSTFLATDLSITTGIEDDLPTEFAVHPAYPNPFNPATTLTVDLPTASPIGIDVFDATGRRVRSMPAMNRPAGRHRIELDAADLAGGLYLVRVRAGLHVGIRSVILLR